MFSVSEICKLTGIHRRRLHCWQDAGYLHPVRIGDSGRACRFGYRTLDVLTVALVLHLRSQKCALQQCWSVARWLQSQSIESLELDFENQKMLLMLIGDCEVFPKLLSRDAVLKNPTVELDEAIRCGIKMKFIDLQEALIQLRKKISILKCCEQHSVDMGYKHEF